MRPENNTLLIQEPRERIRAAAGEPRERIRAAAGNLDVIEMLFDFYFVQPEKTRQKREALNEKLKDMGKPGLK